MSTMRQHPLRTRFLGMALFTVGIGLVVVIALIQSARLDRIDALNLSGYYLPSDFVIGAVCLASLVIGGLLIWRARD